MAGATTSGAGLGYLGYKTWDSRRKPVEKSFDDEYVSKVSLRPVLSAVKSTAKKVMGGVKGGWEASKPQQPFEVMNAPVAAGKSLGTQVGYAARGGWEQLSQGQKYAGMAASFDRDAAMPRE